MIILTDILLLLRGLIAFLHTNTSKVIPEHLLYDNFFFFVKPFYKYRQLLGHIMNVHNILKSHDVIICS